MERGVTVGMTEIGIAEGFAWTELELSLGSVRSIMGGKYVCECACACAYASAVLVLILVVVNERRMQ